MTAGGIEGFASAVSAGPVLGLDLGKVNMGVAVSDGLLTAATPLKTIRFRKQSAAIAMLLEEASASSATGIVIGLPLNMDGSEGPRCQSARAFAGNLSARCALPLAFWDERLSTVAAERVLIEADLSRKRRSEVVDSVAAAFILQGALDRMSNLRGSR